MQKKEMEEREPWGNETHFLISPFPISLPQVTARFGGERRIRTSEAFRD